MLRSFDLPGAPTVIAWAALLVFAIVRGPVFGWHSSAFLECFVEAVVFLVVIPTIEAKTADPLVPMQLSRSRSLVAWMTITFLYMGTFRTLSYFITTLFQTVQGFTELQSGLAFLVPSFAIVAGAQVGERLATRISTGTTLVIGMVMGLVGTALLVPATGVATNYLAIVPGLFLSGNGRGIVWTDMWVAAASGVSQDEQGVASGMASTTRSVGNAIGLAVLIAVANGHAAGQVGIAHLAAVAEGIRLAFWLAAGGIVVSLLAAPMLPRKASVTGL